MKPKPTQRGSERQPNTLPGSHEREKKTTLKIDKFEKLIDICL